jgi:phosphorylcholine metabolism protein LicD
MRDFFQGKDERIVDGTRYTRYLDLDKLYGIVVYGDGFEKEYAYTLSELRPILVDFEDMKVCVPQAYDAALKKNYGDYMTLPPLDQQKPQQDYITFFWKDK